MITHTTQNRYISKYIRGPIVWGLIVQDPNCPGPFVHFFETDNWAPGQSGTRQLGPGAIGPQTVRLLNNWVPDSWAPGPICRGPDYPGPKLPRTTDRAADVKKWEEGLKEDEMVERGAGSKIQWIQ